MDIRTVIKGVLMINMCIVSNNLSKPAGFDNPNIEITDIDDDLGLPGYTEVFGVKLSDDFLKARRYFPHIHDTIGFFFCLLKKKKSHVKKTRAG